MPMNVWAQAPIAAPGFAEVPTCPDTALSERGRGGRSELLTERGFGQYGWDWGITFTTLVHLRDQLRTGPPWRHGPTVAGEVQRLALFAHGGPGFLMVHGQGNEPYLSAENFSAFERTLREVGAFLAPDATVLLMGCICGSGTSGTRLLEVLSGGSCWPGRTVVAFQRTGITFDQTRPRDHCQNPGMRLTPWAEATVGGADSRDLNGAGFWEWASERSGTAKVGLNGVVRNNLLDHGGQAPELIEGTSDPAGWGHFPGDTFHHLVNFPPLTSRRARPPGGGNFRTPGRRR